MVKLRHYQEKGVQGIYDFAGRCLLADDPGLGKTIMSYAWISRIPKRRPVVIVTPSSLKYQWQDEGLLHFRTRTRVLEGTRPKVKKLKDEIIIINYDILSHWLPVLLRRQPQVVILDECQFVSNYKAKRTKAARELAQSAASVIALSGTPMTNKAVQLWSVLNIIRPDIFPSFHNFAWEFTNPRMSHWGWIYKGAKNKSKLYQILTQECMIRRLKKDVAKELPAKTHIMLPMKLSPASAREYAEARDSFINWLRKKSPAAAHKAKKAQSLVKVGYLLRLCAKLRFKQTAQFIKEFSEANPGKQIVGLTGHTNIIDRLKDQFPKSAIVDGRVTGMFRTQTIRRFTAGKTPYFWGNWRAAGTGLNLQTSHHFIALDPPWTPGDLIQGQDRVHRIGQKEKVIVYYLFAMNTIEEEWLRILRERASDLKAILDGNGNLEASDIYGELINKLL